MKHRNLWPSALLFLALIGDPRSVQSAPLRDDATLRRALSDELKRTMTELVVPNESRPYYVAIKVQDTNSLKLVSESGSLVLDHAGQSRNFKMDMRVGSPKMDNSMGGTVEFWHHASQYPLDDSYLAVRRTLWRIADDAYKNALEALNRKKSMLASRSRKAGPDVPDFTPGAAHQAVSPPLAIDVEKQRISLRERITQLSTQLAKNPTILYSSVQGSLEVERSRLLDSEGTYTDQTESYASLSLYAKVQADDGMILSIRVPYTARTADGLPSFEEMQTGVKGLIARLEALRTAKSPESGQAIVLFEAEASKQLIASLIGNSFSGAPSPQYAEGVNDSSLASKLGTDVISPLLSIFDDPTANLGQAQLPLWGHYLADGEGVLAQRVSLVENGVLKSLLMSRAPRKEIAQSNGHARNGVPNISNLFVSSKKALSKSQLLERALKESRRGTGKPLSVYVVRRLSNRSGPQMEQQMLMGGTQSLDTFEPSEPVYAEEAYLIDGKSEVPVRGLLLEDLTMRSLRDVLAAGNDVSSQNFDGGNKISITAPSLLLGRVDTRPTTGELPRLPAYAPPKP